MPQEIILAGPRTFKKESCTLGRKIFNVCTKASIHKHLWIWKRNWIVYTRRRECHKLGLHGRRMREWRFFALDLALVIASDNTIALSLGVHCVNNRDISYSLRSYCRIGLPANVNRIDASFL